MRRILGPVLSFALLISPFGLLANAYVDHNEFIARAAVDGLSTRGESLAVPFQHSLREFLEGAADMYQRSLDEYASDGTLEARASPVTVHVSMEGRVGENGEYKVPSTTLLSHFATLPPANAIERTKLEFTAPDKSWNPKVLYMDRTLEANGLQGTVYLMARQKKVGPRPVTVHIKVEGKPHKYKVQSNTVPLKNLAGNWPIPLQGLELILDEHGVERSLDMNKTIDENRIEGNEVTVMARRKGAGRGKGK
ncbi:hypothetical protein DFP72DRAFT_845345 [Ephemerocybe angulata]|uniref:Uncharacterized protein n=1 Tax=Ephemerocybe angulata TaxID=980116 RepID=A0A8H6I5Q5_9AGAR|nr:hypothetical protein DFP72DRAFT_845345 [Tulosesus angulatus]